MLKVREVIYNDTVASIFRRNVAIHPDKTAFMMDDKKISFQEVCFKSNLSKFYYIDQF